MDEIIEALKLTNINESNIIKRFKVHDINLFYIFKIVLLVDTARTVKKYFIYSKYFKIQAKYELFSS